MHTRRTNIWQSYTDEPSFVNCLPEEWTSKLLLEQTVRSIFDDSILTPLPCHKTCQELRIWYSPQTFILVLEELQGNPVAIGYPLGSASMAKQGSLSITLCRRGRGCLDTAIGFTLRPRGKRYIGDKTSTIKRFDARTGAFLDVFAGGNGMVYPMRILLR